jgi:hypothetical protein
MGPPGSSSPTGTAYGLPKLVDLRWDQVDFGTATLHVRRVKKGTPQHPSNPRRRTAGVAATARAGT